MVARIDPACPPYPPEVAERLDAMMPPGVPPILPFRTFVRNLPMASAMGGWGSYERSKRLCRCATARSSSTARAPDAGASTSGEFT